MTPAQRVCWALARECRDDDVLLVGVATPLAAVAAFLARELLVPDMTIIVGGAVDPPPLDLAELIVNPLAASAIASTTLGQCELLSLLQRGSITLNFVSPAQVDHTGALNTSKVHVDGQWRKLPGCLALPDTSVMAGRLIAYRIEGGERFIVNQVDHVTGIGRATDFRSRRGISGRGVVAVVTDEGRREVTEHGLSPLKELEEIPPEAVDLLNRLIDKHGVLGIESRSGRRAAREKLDLLADEVRP